MEIEKEIKQTKPFKSTYERALVNIMFSYGWVVDKQKQLFKPFGITPKQYNILRILRGAGKPLTTSELRERLLDKMSDTTRLIDRMIKKEWVLKDINKGDRRLVDIVITTNGLGLLAQIDSKADQMESIMNRLSKEEATVLSQLLDKMREEESDVSS